MNVLEIVLQTIDDLLLQLVLLPLQHLKLFTQLQVSEITAFFLEHIDFLLELLLIDEELANALKLVVLLLRERTLTLHPCFLHLLEHAQS